MTLTFELPLPPDRGNARMHWRVTLRHKKAYWAHLDALLAVRHLPAPPRTPLDQARLTAHFRLHNRMDEDNLMARVKYPLDWLVRNGYIANDDWRRVKWAGIPTQEINRKSKGLTVTLTPYTAEEAA